MKCDVAILWLDNWQLFDLGLLISAYDWSQFVRMTMTTTPWLYSAEDWRRLTIACLQERGHTCYYWTHLRASYYFLRSSFPFVYLWPQRLLAGTSCWITDEAHDLTILSTCALGAVADVINLLTTQTQPLSILNFTNYLSLLNTRIEATITSRLLRYYNSFLWMQQQTTKHFKCGTTQQQIKQNIFYDSQLAIVFYGLLTI